VFEIDAAVDDGDDDARRDGLIAAGGRGFNARPGRITCGPAAARRALPVESRVVRRYTVGRDDVIRFDEFDGGSGLEGGDDGLNGLTGGEGKTLDAGRAAQFTPATEAE
jgi:hypothetical protein